ncbi:MAG: thioredoxin domain-containing protein [Polyangiaceae bacterium]|nr:thioredoxin domain-containing protein [Polyangiaceae bacterium]
MCVSQSYSLFAVVLALTAAVVGCGTTEELPPDCAPAIGESPTRGPEDAWVTIVEFADFQCPYCGSVVPTLKKVDTERPDVVRWVFKHLPLSTHPRALPASIAAECAHEQDLFWPMYDALYSHQSALSDDALESYAEAAGVDLEEWRTCLDSNRPKQVISSDHKQAVDAQIPGTPAFFVNGTPLIGAEPLGNFLDAVDKARKKAKQSGLEPAEYYDELVAKGCG